jgi:hypothetical protein
MPEGKYLSLTDLPREAGARVSPAGDARGGRGDRGGRGPGASAASGVASG